MTVSELDKKQLASLRAQLLAAREALVSRPKTAPAAGQPDVGDGMDVAEHAGENEAAGARNERDAARVADIDHALAKVDRGEYGVSEDSGEPIGYGRLHAIPWARLTVAEEEALERRQ